MKKETENGENILKVIEAKIEELKALEKHNDEQLRHLAFVQKLFSCWEDVGEDCFITVLVSKDGNTTRLNIKQINPAAFKIAD